MPPPVDRSELADRLHSAAIHLLRRLRKQDEASGLSAARMSALSVVVFGGPVTIGQLASAEQVSAPTMTRLVEGLERDGHIKRQRDARDARVTWIHPTAKGTRVLQEGRRRRVAELARDVDALSDVDADYLARATSIIERMTGRGSLSPREPHEAGPKPRSRTPSLRDRRQKP
jgi:DNA-binding MarR family transcriptional regulator